jgi:hypothetical protein
VSVAILQIGPVTAANSGRPRALNEKIRWRPDGQQTPVCRAWCKKDSFACDPPVFKLADQRCFATNLTFALTDFKTFVSQNVPGSGKSKADSSGVF